MSKICIIVPCYNEADRIDLEAFRVGGEELFQVVFVNDGSEDHTYDVLTAHQASNWHVLNLEENVGKGEAIRRGMMYVREQEFFDHIDWVGFWDADLATPLYEVHRSLRYGELFYPDADVIIGSRIDRLGSRIRRSRVRHYFGRVFITVVDTLFRIGCYDTQCGAKLFRPHVVDWLFTDPFVSRWIFDVELLLRMRQRKECKAFEYPVLEWCEVGGSKLVVHRTILRVLWDIGLMFRKYGRCS